METIISRGTANTRMRDFYDIYILMKLQGHNINNKILEEAIIATIKRRGSLNLLSERNQILEEIFSNNVLSSHWTSYQKEYSYADDISWDEVEEAVLSILSSL